MLVPALLAYTALSAFIVETNTEFMVSFVLFLSLVVRPLYIFRAFNESALDFHRNYLTDLASATVSAVMKVTACVLGLPLPILALAYLIETILAASILLISRNKIMSSQKYKKIRGVLPEALKKVRESFYLLLSSLSVIIYVKIDQVMIVHFLGAAENGQYSVAVRILEAFTILFTMAVGLLLPAFVRLQQQDETTFRRFRRNAYCIGILLSLSTVAVVLATSASAINILVGSQYGSSHYLLNILIWSLPLIVLGSVSGKHLITEKLDKIILTRTMIACLVNILGNLYAIPIFGAEGAAATTVIANLIGSVGLLLFFKEGRKVLHDIISSFNLIRYARPLQLVSSFNALKNPT